MPTPLSRTRITASSPSWLTVIRMSPPVSVYFAALLSRLTTTCSMRAGSASTQIGSVGSDTEKSCLRASMKGRAVSAAWLTTTRSSTCSLVSRSFPLVIRLMSNRSSTRRTISPTWRSMMLPACSMIGSFVFICRRMFRALTNRREGAAQFVGQQGHELFLAAIGFGQTVGPLPLGLRRLAFGEVVHHSGE